MRKRQVQVYFSKKELKQIGSYRPFFGSTIPGIIRYIVTDWIRDNIKEIKELRETGTEEDKIGDIGANFAKYC